MPPQGVEVEAQAGRDDVVEVCVEHVVTGQSAEIVLGFRRVAERVPGGEGHVFFDDIRLYRPPVEP